MPNPGSGIALCVSFEKPAKRTKSSFPWRPSIFSTILFFAMAIRPLGLVISGLASFLIAALGSHETRWIEAIVVGTLLTATCAVLFPYVLGLPMPLFPRFLVQ